MWKPLTLNILLISRCVIMYKQHFAKKRDEILGQLTCFVVFYNHHTSNDVRVHICTNANVSAIENRSQIADRNNLCNALQLKYSHALFFSAEFIDLYSRQGNKIARKNFAVRCFHFEFAVR